MKNLLSWFCRSKVQSRSTSRRSSVRLAIENLESREVPAMATAGSISSQAFAVATVGSFDSYVSPITIEYKHMGGKAGVLGSATSAEMNVPGGRGQHFQHGEIDWSKKT